MSSTNLQYQKGNNSDIEIDYVPVSLHKELESNQLLDIKAIFDKNDKKLSSTQLREILIDVMNICFPNDQWDILFMKMNYKGDGLLSWDEFISFLLLCFNQDEIEPGFSELDLPINSKPKLERSLHCYPINKISYFPTVYSDRSINFQDGSILTCSSDGTINYWSFDLEFERSVKSNSPVLQIQTTWITDMVAMPDLSVICLASTERDLRFYDTSARKFELRIYLTYLPHFVTAMYYDFSKVIEDESKLVIGDIHGNVQVILLNSIDRGPFRSKLGMPLLTARFEDVVRGTIIGMRIINLERLHMDSVRQLAYSTTLRSVFSCSNCSKSAMVLVDIGREKSNYTYKVESGIWCFAHNESAYLLVTGGPDCLVRIWNPFMPSHPIAILHGHHQGIVGVVLQVEIGRAYSLSKDKCIKVWDIGNQNCVQTYLGLPPELGEYSDLTTFYNPKSRQWIIGSTMLSVLSLSPEKEGEHTDGNTHTSGVSMVLYNTLYKVLVSCGLDRRWIAWDPWSGRKLMTVDEAHGSEITAATYDPSLQRLLTGAHDGTLKIWNFNTGVCLRNMHLASSAEVKCVVWTGNRILGMGWNRTVTEFQDTVGIAGQGTEFCKDWCLKHDEDISCATVAPLQSLVTGTYEGEIIFWKLETGQPYRRHNASDPATRIKIQYQQSISKNRIQQQKHIAPTQRSLIANIRKSIAAPSGTSLISRTLSIAPPQSNTPITTSSPKFSRRISVVQLPESSLPLRRLGIHVMLILRSRLMQPNVGTLVVSLQNGTLQMWSHHVSGGFLTSFSAIHKAGDYVISMISDSNDEFLFIGTSAGYIKTWLIKNYCTGNEEANGTIHYRDMIRYRLMFPFLWGQRIPGRAQRIATFQGKPLLLNSFKAHSTTVSNLTYIEESRILVSSSADNSVRMWTLSGRYINTLGTFKPWRPVPQNDLFLNEYKHVLPPDLKRILSATSRRVLSGGAPIRELSMKEMKKQTEKELTRMDLTKIYGERLQEPILRTYYSSFEGDVAKEVKLDSTFPYIPIYQHLVMLQPDEWNQCGPDDRKSLAKCDK